MEPSAYPQSGTSTHPMTGFLPQAHMSVEEFKRQLIQACDYSAPSYRSKVYKQVKVLLLYWEIDDLGVEPEVGRLHDCFRKGYHYQCVVKKIPVDYKPSVEIWMLETLADMIKGSTEDDLHILYYGGHGRAGKFPGENPSWFVSGSWPVPHPNGTVVYREVAIDFSKIKSATLDTHPADALYFLDCCYAATAAIGEGKELLAACAVESKTPGPGYFSFTSALVQQLVHAEANNRFVTAAQIHYLMLTQTWEGKLERTPLHVETKVGPQPRTSIYLAPLRSQSRPATSGPPMYLQLSESNSVALGSRRADLKVLLTVSLRGASPQVLQQMRTWLLINRPPAIKDIGVSFEYTIPSSSQILFFIMPVAAWYCLQSHPAIAFVGYVKWPDMDTQPSGIENLPPRGQSYGGDRGKGQQGRGGRGGGRGGPGDGGRGGRGAGGMGGPSGYSIPIR
ncbi:MAG: hypothetical protein Q9210_003450 [Variospora velana]